MKVNWKAVGEWARRVLRIAAIVAPQTKLPPKVVSGIQQADTIERAVEGAAKQTPPD